MEGQPKPRRTDWSLSGRGFDRLLTQLDPDRERAGERYEALRLKLTRLFQWRGGRDPEELADVVFDRVARRLEEGTELHGDPYLFFHGVALLVLREHWRDPATSGQAIDPVLRTRAAASEGAIEPDDQRRHECLDQCLEGLPPESRSLLERYHRGEKGVRIRARGELAAAVGISMGALRIRAYRIRAQLEACITACEQRAAPP